MATDNTPLEKVQQRYDLLDLDRVNNLLPARVLQQMVPDPAEAVPGAAPIFGEMALPHIFTQAGRYGAQGRAYAWYDEAIRDSWTNAERMRRDAGIMESLECRQRSTALLKWHIEPEEEGDDDQKKLAANMTRILDRTPMFLDYRRCLLEAIWYGRYACVCSYEKQYVGNHMRTVVQRWEPRQGDKLVFRYEDGTLRYNPQQVGIRIGSGYDPDPLSKLNYRHHRQRKIEATQYGLTYWLDAYERKTMALHKHIIEDSPYHDSLRAGSIHGVGIRDRIYLTWYMMVECLQRAIEYLDRSALGVEIWSYPAHNANAEAATRTAAEERIGGGRSIVLVPVFTGQDAEQYGVQHIEPGVAGLDALMNVIREYFGHQIKRYILGQTLSSEAAATGLGSGVADAHLATYADIVRYDARKLEETVTREFLRNLQLWNFPGSEGTWLRFVIDTDSPDAESKMAAYQQAWEMGAELKSEDVLSMIGASKPEPEDDTLYNPQLKHFRDAQEQGIGQGVIEPGDMQNRQGGQLSSQDIQGPGGLDPNAFNIPQDADGDMIAGEGTSRAQVSGGSYGVQYDQTGEEQDSPEQYARGSLNLAPGHSTAAKQPLPGFADMPKSTDQEQAGNYRHGHLAWNGLRISIETEKGVSRAPELDWPPMAARYGYIRQTEGKDGDQVDVFVGENLESDIVVIIDQVTEGGAFDEHKVLIGFDTPEEAIKAYKDSYTPDWKVGPVTVLRVDQFKKWLSEGNQKKQAKPQKPDSYSSRSNSARIDGESSDDLLPLEVVLDDPTAYMGRTWSDLEQIHRSMSRYGNVSAGMYRRRRIKSSPGQQELFETSKYGNKGQNPGIYTDDPPKKGEQRRHKPLVKQTSSYTAEKVPGPAHPRPNVPVSDVAEPPEGRIDYADLVWRAYQRRMGVSDG